MMTVNLYEPIHAQHGSPPLVLRVVLTNQNQMVGGVPSGSQKIENYVLLSCLPEELKQRVQLAVQALASGM